MRVQVWNYAWARTESVAHSLSDLKMGVVVIGRKYALLPSLGH